MAIDIARVRVIKDKLVKALQDEKIPPTMGFTFGLWLSRVFDMSDLDFLNDWEKQTSEQTVNNWMVGVLVESGRYKTDGYGSVYLDPKTVEVEPGGIQFL